MAWLKESIISAIEDDRLNGVLFTDPLSDETRKAKRNVLVASFICLLIATLHLQITTFAGFATSATPTLGSDLAQGLSCLVVVYLLVGFVFHSFVDYNAWKFDQERAVTQPFVDLIVIIGSNQAAVKEQIANALYSLKDYFEATADENRKTNLNSGIEQIKSIEKHQDELNAELKPLLLSWAQTIRRSKRLTWRLGARHFQLWVLDFAIPLIFAGFAVYKAFQKIGLVWLTLSA
jgi:hypothetical protein